MKTIKLGIFGFTESSYRIKAILTNGASIVAVCDAREEKLAKAKEELGKSLATYTNFEDLLSHPGLDAIYICNFFHCHAPYAVRALERGIHVLSECISNGTMAEGVALVRAAEKSKSIYMLAENFQYMRFNLEMRRLAEGGTLGKIIYAEGDYNHPY
ncbi:MAG: Gfo/Idh/MocA family oxidoreductase, partial [Ruminococcaceae bacterium]|nr:Gfo/Idh/MocA family oxidoreductase [Oscillospiraceae bacterium]